MERSAEKNKNLVSSKKSPLRVKIEQPSKFIFRLKKAINIIALHYDLANNQKLILQIKLTIKKTLS